MKTKSVGMVVLLIMGLFSDLFSQDIKTDVKGTIEPYALGIPFDRTVNLVFPYSIKSVDRGNSGVLIQKPNGVGNLLQIKAAEIDFTPTNLTVVTGEGALYSFNLHYDNKQPRLNFNVSEMARPIYQEIKFDHSMGNEADIIKTADRVALKRKTTKGLSHNKYDMNLVVNGIYVSGDMLYFHILLENKSNLSYDTDQFRLYIRDKKSVKRSASQELELLPVHTEGNHKRIAGQSLNAVVLGMEKFTIPDKKVLVLEIMERNGGRNLTIKIRNKDLIKAEQI